MTPRSAPTPWNAEGGGEGGTGSDRESENKARAVHLGLLRYTCNVESLTSSSKRLWILFVHLEISSKIYGRWLQIWTAKTFTQQWTKKIKLHEFLLPKTNLMTSKFVVQFRVHYFRVHWCNKPPYYKRKEIKEQIDGKKLCYPWKNLNSMAQYHYCFIILKYWVMTVEFGIKLFVWICAIF